jgi:hypothetical protein
MSTLKSLLAIGMILLFLGVAISPVTARPTLRETTVEIPEFLDELTDAMAEATSVTELVEVINGFITEYGRHPFLTLLLEIVIGIINFGNKFDAIRPIKRNAFILSWGFTSKINPFKNNKFDLYRPLTLWYYSGKSNLLLNSRTIIISFSPFSIKMLTGRQIGFMRNFAGIYYHREKTLSNKAFSFFMGKSSTVRGFDLSFLNVLGQ